MSSIVALFDEAWDHRRRRRRVELLVMALCTAAAVMTYVLIPHGAGAGAGSHARSEAEASAVAPGRVLAQPPGMGVACRIGDSPRCNRIGLAVWLKRPAESVTATIAGMRFPLNVWMQDVTTRRRPRRAFIGYLRQAGIGARLHVSDTDPAHPPSPAVRLTIRYPGRTVVTRLRVPLEPGWG